MQLVGQSETFLTIILLIPRKGFGVRRFIGLEIVRLISLGQFPFRLQPIFEVVAEQSTVGAMDFMGAAQNIFDVHGLADCILAEHPPLRFNFVCNFVM
jgi:hypothetical protein